MESFDLSKQANISPWDALLLAVQRRAARVRWADAVIEEIITQDQKEQIAEGKEPSSIPPESVRSWMAESRKEEILMTRAAKMAIDAGVAEAMIRQMEREGRIVTDALVAGLDVLDLTPEQRLRALTSMHRALTSGSDGDPHLNGAIDISSTEDEDSE